jgi:succinate dehydrogenase/fumarate reductase flavoprotein subunit
LETISPTTCDVLVIGAGGAGLRAALEAARRGARVVVLTKGPVPGGATSVAGGVMQASVDPSDSPDQHFRDTVVGGHFLNNQRLVRTFVDNAAEKVLDLERYGCAFDRKEDGSLDLRVPAGATRKRGIEGEVMSNVQKILAQRILELGAEIREFVMVTRLLQDDRGAVVGAVALDFANGSVLAFLTPVTILAAGAVGRLYSVTACPRSSTGDGLGLARRVGARMVNLEMMQFIPLAYAYPDFIRGFTLGEAPNYGKTTRFLNSNGERYMPGYDPARGEYATRDVAARANYVEIQAGRGTPHGGIWVDTTANDPKDGLYQPHKLADRYKMIVDFYGPAKANFEEPFEATPSALFLMGGVEIDSGCRTSVPGLLAAGEVSGNLHGANRLGANALTEIQVFGAIAGERAAQMAREIPAPTITPTLRSTLSDEHRAILGLHDRPHTRRACDLKHDIQRLMWDGVGIVREGPKLRAALQEFGRLKKVAREEISVFSPARRYNYDWVEALEVVHMVDVAEMMAAAALARTESRGAHHRTDHPATDNERWLKETVVHDEAGELRVETQSVQLTELSPMNAEAAH